MLEEISIKDLGVIQSATLNFTSGLTVITGETGAGKTMVLTALSLLLGKRSDSSIVRHGSAFASVEGCWKVEGLRILPAIHEVGAEVEDGNLYMNRTVHKDGKSRAVVGGKTTPASSLAIIGEGLVNIHGQSDQIRLKNTAAQREALDSYAGSKLSDALTTYKVTYSEWVTLKALIKDLKLNMVARRREYDDLTLALKELEDAQPLKGEDTDLHSEAETLSNIETLEAATQEALLYLNNEESEAQDALESIASAVKALANVMEYDSRVRELHSLAETIQINANELSSGLAEYVSNIDTDAIERLNIVQDRRAVLSALIRKYGFTLDDVLEYWETATQRFTELDPQASNTETMELELGALYVKMEEQAATITQLRTKNSLKLETAVNKELAGLAMGGNKLQITLTRGATYTPKGIDEVLFLLKTPGASEPRPLGKSASGGELSRIMLALEVVLADPNVTPTFIFDEVDSGVGGATAIEIGKRLAQLAKEAQVIVVTHLPQVAAFADNHLLVLKSSSEHFVSTDIHQLSEEEQVEELARMLSGLSDSESGKAHAIELLSVAKAFKLQ